MKWFGSKRVVVSGAIIVLALFLIRPGANRLRTRVVRSISLALGRPVDVGYVRVRLLPRPGFDLENFVVSDDPAFGAEPMLRASDVAASLRLKSLLRGRLEISRLSLTEASLNLVRNADGHWNLERLLERSAQIQVAPTSKGPTEQRPAFPYVEASRGRINLKFGAEKRPYTLTDADFSLWQDSENSWGARLKAQPVRTDFNLTDTGVINLNGTWQRASRLRETPLQFTIVWERAQLGQLSKLAYGNDMGWRGSLKISATLSGTPAALKLQTNLSTDDFHRYDILGNGNLRLAAQCSAQYSSVENIFTDIACQAPSSQGPITLSGTIESPLQSRNYDLALSIQGMPIQSLVNSAHHLTHVFPDDLGATGQVDAMLRFRSKSGRNPSSIEWSGGGEISDLHLTSHRGSGELELHSIPFALVTDLPAVKAVLRRHAIDTADFIPGGTHIEIGPFRVAAGRPTPALVRGWLSRSGFDFQLQGEGQIQRLLQAAHMAGIPAPTANAEGVARVDLQMAGDWSGQTGVKATGRAQLHSVRAQLRGWSEPLEITGADLTLVPDEIQVKNVTAAAAGTTWHGSLTIPRPCGVTGDCPVHFELHADEIASDRLNTLLNPNASQRPWYHFLSSENSGTPYLLTANATGKIFADRLMIHALPASQFSARVALKDGRLNLSDMRAEVLGGRHSGAWEADFTIVPPKYSGSGTFERVSLRQLSAAMHDGWVTGSASATYHASTAGLKAGDLYSSAVANLQIEAWDAVLPHITLTDATSALEARHLSAELTLKNQKVAIENARLDTPDRSYQLSGTASLSRELNLKLKREGTPGFAISGTLAEPRISPGSSAETQAALKP